MTLNASGPISLAGTTAGQSIEVELGGTGTTTISLNDATVRTLAGVASGVITMPTNFWGKSNNFVEIQKIAGPGGLGTTGFGTSAAASSDGSTIVVTLPDYYNGSAYQSTAYVYIKSGATWVQQGSAINFGSTRATTQGAGRAGIAISPDGNTIFLGDPLRSSNVGAVCVYTRSAGTWSLSQTLVGTGYTGGPQQGSVITISSDGLTLAVSGQTNNSSIGAVWIYTLSGGTWSQQSTLIPTGYTFVTGVLFGRSLAISSDGNYLVVGTANGSNAGNNGPGAGWIFTRSGSTWTQAVSALRNTYTNFVGVSETGAIAIASVTSPTKLWFGLSGSSVGVCVLTGSGSTWANNTNSTTTSSIVSGETPSLVASADGSTLYMGLSGDNTVGTAYVYSINSSTGVLTVKQSLIGTGSVGSARQGSSLAVSSDGKVLVSGAPNDNSTIGAVWIFAK
jgi:6-phosphogluconolactonase (cycloisomerase 2 family)